MSHTQRKVLDSGSSCHLNSKYESVEFLLILAFNYHLFLTSFRYDIRIYPTFLHLHGKTFDYKIPYTTVLRLFLLPHKDQRQMFFVVSGLLLPALATFSLSSCFHEFRLSLCLPIDQPGSPHQAGSDTLPLPHPALFQGGGHQPHPQHERVSIMTLPFIDRAASALCISFMIPFDGDAAERTSAHFEVVKLLTTRWRQKAE